VKTIELTDDEALALRRALDAYVEEFRGEAARTEQRDAKRDIWRDEHLLTAIRNKLRAVT
jgi:hypothetical protein